MVGWRGGKEGKGGGKGRIRSAFVAARAEGKASDPPAARFLWQSETAEPRHPGARALCCIRETTAELIVDADATVSSDAHAMGWIEMMHVRVRALRLTWSQQIPTPTLPYAVSKTLNPVSPGVKYDFSS